MSFDSRKKRDSTRIQLGPNNVNRLAAVYPR